MYHGFYSVWDLYRTKAVLPRVEYIQHQGSTIPCTVKNANRPYKANHVVPKCLYSIQYPSDARYKSNAFRVYRKRV